VGITWERYFQGDIGNAWKCKVMKRKGEKLTCSLIVPANFALILWHLRNRTSAI
jgi:hypothetical protein